MSNRLTFSLTSLVFFIALGLVFAPMSVMAHDNMGPGEGERYATHTHPLTATAEEDLNGDNDTNDAGEAVSAHGIHPVPKITLKSVPGKVRDNEVIVTAAANTFPVVISFYNADDKAISVDDDNMSTADTADATLAATRIDLESFNILLLNKDKVPVESASNATIADAVRIAEGGGTGKKGDPIEAVITIPSTFEPGGTGTGVTESMIVQIQLKDGNTLAGSDETAIYSYRTHVLVDATQTVVNGGANLKSAVAEFTLVKAWSNQPPTITIGTTAPTAPVTTGSFDVAYTTADSDTGDTVTVDPTTTATPATAATYYTAAASSGTATITQADPTATTMTIPAASVTLTLTPSDGTADGTAKTITVPFAARTYDPLDHDEISPTVTIGAVTGKPTRAFTVNFIATDDIELATTNPITVAITPATAATAGTPMIDSAGSGKVTITPATPTATTGDLPEQLIRITVTATDKSKHASGPNSGKASIAVTLGARPLLTGPSTPGAPDVDISFAPVDPYSVSPTQRNLLDVILDFDEEIDPMTLKDKLGRAGIDPIEQITDGVRDASYTAKVRYIVRVRVVNGHAAGPYDPGNKTKVKTTDIILKRGVTDLIGNAIAEDEHARYTPTRPMPVITASADAIDCRGGMYATTITVRFTHTDPANAVYKIKEIDEKNPAGGDLLNTEVLETNPGFSVPGWQEIPGSWSYDKATDIATFKVERKPNGRLWLGQTALQIDVVHNAVVDRYGNHNAPKTMTFPIGPVLTIPAGRYYVVIRENARNITHLQDVSTLTIGDPDVRADFVNVLSWECMPDLSLVFDVKPTATYLGGGRKGESGGGLLLLESYAHDNNVAKQSIAKGTVGISEIMWAQDQGIPFGAQSNVQHTRDQWIEIHNLNDKAVTVTLFELYNVEAYSTVSYLEEVDRVSNFDIGTRWEAKGQDGNSQYGIDFISMQRTTGAVGEKDYDHGDHAGNNAGKWSASGFSYLTRRAGLADTGVIKHENLNYHFYGTPGRANGVGLTKPLAKTGVPLSPFVINEVANRSNAHYEWIEIRNTSGAEANLRNYMISVVRSKGDEYALFTFPNSDIKVPKDGLVLVVAADPEDDGEHPLAVGRDILGGNDQVRGIGLDNPNSGIDPADYIVAKTSERFYTEGMPDDGNFLLVLRRSEKVDAANASAKLKTDEWIIDIAGYHNSLGDSNSASDNYSAVWPLKLWRSKPLSNNGFAKDTVHRRRHITKPGVYGENEGDNGKTSFVDDGYTGVGYRRHAHNIAAHGGTPGYHDIRKSLIADVDDGNVRISEIMLDQGDGAGRSRLPQWIEIHNTSPTKAINLHADDGWRLVVENFDDGNMPIARISGTLNFKSSEVQTLLPLQTVLVTSTRARNAGSASVNASVVFIPTRVFSVWADARGALGMSNPADPILSTKGFHIELIDGKGNAVDRVGNLPVDKNGVLIKGRGRSVTTVAWEWSEIEGVAENTEGRSSVFRRSMTKASPMDLGVESNGWISASATSYRRYVDTWYGDEDDIGSPGATIGAALPVSLSKFRPERLESGDIVIRWITESETNNAGFNILRSTERNGQFTQINTSLIAGQGTTSERTTYEWKDTTAKPNVVYYYQIQDVSLDGQVQTLRQSRLKGYLTPSGKLTTTWGDLKALQ